MMRAHVIDVQALNVQLQDSKVQALKLPAEATFSLCIQMIV
jgi:hypothetical protein